MAKTHDEIKEIILNSKDENEARIRMYQWGMNRGYCTSDNRAKERFLTNVLFEPITDIFENPRILWNRDHCKDDFQYMSEIDESKIETVCEPGSNRLLTFDEWSVQEGFKNYSNSFYKICAYVCSVLGSNVFNTFLQNAKSNELPKFKVFENPGFISQHADQFINENEYRLSDAEKKIFNSMKGLCEEYEVEFPNFPIEDIENELWTAIESDEFDICGWLCINKKTKKCYIVKIY